MFSDPKMASDENLFRLSILHVVGEVLRDLQASMTERALFRLDRLLDVVNRMIRRFVGYNRRPKSN